MNKTLILIFVIAVVGFLGLNIWRAQAQEKASKSFEVQKSDVEWKEQLSPQAYKVLRHHSTERPHTSPLNEVKETGAFLCAGCGHLLFLSDHKYDSGTGWPSFYQPATNDALGSKTDYKLLMARNEVHCSRCGGHLGHVFPDGPKPTGKRYCINGVSLEFKSKKYRHRREHRASSDKSKPRRSRGHRPPMGILQVLPLRFGMSGRVLLDGPRFL